MIIDGRKIAEEILARTKARAGKLPFQPKVLAVVASQTPATRSYLVIKGRRAADAGCALDVRMFPEDVTAAELRSAASESDAEAVIVQLPLPEHIDTREICDAVPLAKDADVLSTAARDKFDKADADALLPPVVRAIREVLMSGNIEMKGKKAIVIGDGWLVGKPAALWLRQEGADVEVANSKSNDIAGMLRSADIIVSGAGAPHLIKPEMLKEGVVLIDAGTSESSGVVVGDADPACAAKCSLFTPVPGGVGPIAVACLFENAVILAERK